MFKKILPIFIMSIAIGASWNTMGFSVIAEDETVASIVHGLTLNTKRQPIKVTPTIILNTQKMLLQRIEKQADKSQLDALAKQREVLATKEPLTEGDRIWANAIMLGALLQNNDSTEATTARVINLNMLSKYAASVGKSLSIDDLIKNTPPIFADKNLHTALSPSISIADLLSILKIKLDVNLYEAKCKFFGVPVPPPFGDPLWKNEGNIPADQSYLTPLTDTVNNHNPISTIYSYTSPNPSHPHDPEGFCLALPIIQDSINHPNSWNALGVICQSISTGPNKTVSNSHTCFLDNATDSFPVLAPGQTYALDSGKFIAPPDLPANNMCTDCHAGENAFVIHVGTPLESAKNTFNINHPTNNFTTRNNWYKPLLDADWPQNPEAKPYPTGNGLCSSCHNAGFAGRLPNVGEGMSYTPTVTGGVSGGFPTRDTLFKFCDFVLPNFLTADTAGGVVQSGNMNGNVAGNATAVTTLYNACSTLTPTPLIPLPAYTTPNAVPFPLPATSVAGWGPFPDAATAQGAWLKYHTTPP